MKNIKNYTGHMVRYFGPSGEIPFPPEGDIQLTYEMEQHDTVKRIPIMRKMFLRDSLPPRQDGTYYIVSTLVAAAFPHRDDLISPSDTIRDKLTGEVIGCGSFSLIGKKETSDGKETETQEKLQEGI